VQSAVWCPQCFAGAVVQRFGYEAYGRAEVLAANWQAAADGYDWEVRYAGNFH
jgi:hypothetical protein